VSRNTNDFIHSARKHDESTLNDDAWIFRARQHGAPDILSSLLIKDGQMCVRARACVRARSQKKITQSHIQLF